MAVNSNKPEQWKQDIAASVDMYNDWFMRSAPAAFRKTRGHTTKEVEDMLVVSRNLTNVGVELLRKKPSVLSSLRMSTCPPLARDRLIGLASVSKNLVSTMEKSNRLPPNWLERKTGPTEKELFRAATIVADRLCGAEANPILRNAHEERQLAAIDDWLSGEGDISI